LNKAIWDDYIDFKMRVVDNGDQKVTASFNLADGKTADIECN